MGSFFYALTAALGYSVVGVKSMMGMEGAIGNLENTLYMDLAYGRVVIEMRCELAPNHCIRIKELVRQGFYDGQPFHRVIGDFMVQTGDPTGTGRGGSGQRMAAEFSPSHFRAGSVGMARSSDPDSADSQFFIVLRDSPHLDGQYTLWGQVIAGGEFLAMIKKGDPSRNGYVGNPDRIKQLVVASDVH